MNLKNILAVAIATAISFSGSISAFAATTEKNEKIPDLIYSRTQKTKVRY